MDTIKKCLYDSYSLTVGKSPSSSAGVGLRRGVRGFACKIDLKVAMTSVSFPTDSSSDILEFISCSTFSRALGNPAVASWVYLTYCMDRNSCKAVKGWTVCVRERANRASVYFDTSQLHKRASSSICKSLYFSLFGEIELFVSCPCCSKLLKSAGFLTDSLTPMRLK